MKWTNKDIVKAIQRLERKVDVLLEHSNIDFSREDASVRSMTDEVKEATHHIPPRISPETNQQEGK